MEEGRKKAYILNSLQSERHANWGNLIEGIKFFDFNIRNATSKYLLHYKILFSVEAVIEMHFPQKLVLRL